MTPVSCVARDYGSVLYFIKFPVITHNIQFFVRQQTLC